MLAHFYVSSMTDAEQRAIASDWIVALKDYPAWAIQEACTEWLQTETRKPTIAAIRALCAKRFEVVPWMRKQAMAGPVQIPADRDVSAGAEQRAAQAKAIMEKFQFSRGRAAQ